MGGLLQPREGSHPDFIASGHVSWFSKSKSGLTNREWNAFIGIVTAIVGNILISFALNLQRYAHIRLNRDKLRRQKSWASGRSRRNIESMGYGTQEDIAAQRAELNREAPPLEEDDEEHRARYHDNEDSGESTPLRGERRRSVSTGSTVKPGEKMDGEDFKPKTYLKSGYWWAGIILMTCGEAGNFLAYGFAPASIVSPLGVVALISNCIIAPCLLKERFRQRDFWGVVIAVGGAVTVVFSAENGEKKMGPHDIWKAITRWEFELYLGLTAAAIVILMWASSRYGHKSILIDLGLVGLFGGYTALTTKGIASLLSDTLWRVITFPVSYLLVFILVSTALLQIRYINKALQRFDSTQVIPTQFVCFTLSVIIGSAVLYREFESVSAERLAKFVGGCGLTFLGVFFITSGRSKEHDDDEDDFSEEGIRLMDEEAQEYRQSTPEDAAATSIRPTTSGEEIFAGKHATPPASPSHQRSYASGTAPRKPSRMNSNTSTISQPFTPQSVDSPLIDNPWLSSEERLGSRNQLVPSSAQIRNEQSRSSNNLGPSRPATPRAETHPGPSGDTEERRGSLARRSVTHLFPGPLISPLSSSLTGIVADNLRRGVDSPSRKRRGGLSRFRSLRDERATESETLLPGQTGDDAPEGRKRSRSISETWSAMIRRVSSKSKGSLRDEESGSQGRDEQQTGESSRS